MKFLKPIFYLFAIVLIFLVSLSIFAPKNELYYMLEKELAKHSVMINEESIKTDTLSLKSSKSTIYFAKNEVAKVQEITFSLFSISASKITLQDTFKQFFPPNIAKVEISLLSQSFSSVGDFGEANGKVDLKNKKVTVFLTPSKLVLDKYKQVLSQFKKIDERYQYELSF